MNFRQAANRVATAFVLENEEAVVNFIRSYMVKRVEGFSAGQLVYAIENKQDLWSNIPRRYKAFAERFRQNPQVKLVVAKYTEKVNVDLVLQWLHADVPELYGVFVNWPGLEARAWLEEETKKVKAGLLS